MTPEGLSTINFQLAGVSPTIDALLRGSTHANVICRLVIYGLPRHLQSHFDNTIAGDFACIHEVSKSIGFSCTSSINTWPKVG